MNIGAAGAERVIVMDIYGEKIMLRAIGIQDTDILLRLINDPYTENMLCGSSFPVSREAQLKWISDLEKQREVLRCIVAEKDNQEQGLGTIILSDIDMKNGTAQIHIKMDEKIGRGRGYGKDALKAIIKYAFNELRLNCLYAEILAYNAVSQELFKKCGFHKDGVMRERLFKSGVYVDVILFSLLQKEYSSNE